MDFIYNNKPIKVNAEKCFKYNFIFQNIYEELSAIEFEVRLDSEIQSVGSHAKNILKEIFPKEFRTQQNIHKAIFKKDFKSNFITSLYNAEIEFKNLFYFQECKTFTNHNVEAFLHDLYLFLISVGEKISNPTEQLIFFDRMFKGKTLEEVGEAVNLTRERVRQIEKNLLLPIKNMCSDLVFLEKMETIMIYNEGYPNVFINMLNKVFDCKAELKSNFIFLHINSKTSVNYEPIMLFEHLSDFSLSTKIQKLIKMEDIHTFDGKIIYSRHKTSGAEAVRFLIKNTSIVNLKNVQKYKKYIDEVTKEDVNIFDEWFLTSRKTLNLSTGYEQTHKPRIYSQLISDSIYSNSIPVSEHDYLNLDYMLNIDEVINFLNEQFQKIKNYGNVNVKTTDLDSIAQIAPPIKYLNINGNEDYLLLNYKSVYFLAKKFLLDQYKFNSKNSMSFEFKDIERIDFIRYINSLDKLLINTQTLVNSVYEAENTLKTDDKFKDFIKVTQTGKTINKVYIRKLLENTDVKQFFDQIKNDAINKPTKTINLDVYIENFLFMIEKIANTPLADESIPLSRNLIITFFEEFVPEMNRIGFLSLFTLNDFDTLFDYVKYIIEKFFNYKTTDVYLFRNFISAELNKNNDGAWWNNFFKTFNELVEKGVVTLTAEKTIEFNSSNIDLIDKYLNQRMIELILKEKIFVILEEENYQDIFGNKFNYYEICSALKRSNKINMVDIKTSTVYLNGYKCVLFNSETAETIKLQKTQTNISIDDIENYIDSLNKPRELEEVRRKIYEYK